MNAIISVVAPAPPARTRRPCTRPRCSRGRPRGRRRRTRDATPGYERHGRTPGEQVERDAQLDVHVAQRRRHGRLERPLQRDARRRGSTSRTASGIGSPLDARTPAPEVPLVPVERDARSPRSRAGRPRPPRDRPRRRGSPSLRYVVSLPVAPSRQPGPARGRRTDHDRASAALPRVRPRRPAAPVEHEEPERDGKGLREIVAAQTQDLGHRRRAGASVVRRVPDRGARRARHVRGGRLPPAEPAAPDPGRARRAGRVHGRAARRRRVHRRPDADARAADLADVDAAHDRLGGLGLRPRRLGYLGRGRRAARRSD